LEVAEMEGLGKTRIDALSDGIFSVALTLLVARLAVPDLTKPWWHDLWPKVVAIILSFLIAAIYWVAHNNESRLIKGTTRSLLWLNLLFLLSIIFLPFSTELLTQYRPLYGDSDHARIAIITYGVNVILIGLLLQFVWTYATQKNLLVDSLNNPPENYQVGRTTLRNLSIPVIVAIAIAVSFKSIVLSYIVLLCAPVVYVLTTLVQRPRRA
jgi:uncharacterized membrane protein